jgi:hypothetical protein
MCKADSRRERATGDKNLHHLERHNLRPRCGENGSALRLEMSKSFCGERLRASRGDRALLPRTARHFTWERSSASAANGSALHPGTTERFAWGRPSASRWNGCSLLRFAPGRGHRVLGLTRTGARRLGGGARGVAVGRSC